MAKFEKPDEKKLKQELTPEQFHVTQQCGTEPPFQNEFWDNKREGLYVDIVSGEPLFTSIHKFDSGTGWPSFTKPIRQDNINFKKENDVWQRVEVRSAQADSHLGHVFEDGPREAGGLRYCINSAALRFVPLEKLEAEGYGEFISMFKK